MAGLDLRRHLPVAAEAPKSCAQHGVYFVADLLDRGLDL